MVGHRFGRLEVIERAEIGAKGRALWRCECDCGVVIVAVGIDLRQGDKKSCGCARAGSMRPGFRFGNWTVIERMNPSPRRARWWCRCDCGTVKTVSARTLQRGQSSSCGCAGRVEWIGLRVSRLVVVAKAPKNRHGQSMWLCRCDCGVEKVVSSTCLRGSRTVLSCGCWKRESDKRRKPNLKHGQSRTSVGKRSPTYHSWLAMMARCHRPTAPDYARYGGAGITVCDRWHDSFEAFRSDMGERVPGTTLDRKDGTKGYSPDNCRWATDLVQARNKRSVKLTADSANEALGRMEHGESCASIARRMGLTAQLLYGLKSGRAWKELPRTAAHESRMRF